MERTQEIYDDQMVCPHCKKPQTDAWEFEQESGKVECGSCENEFHYSRNRSTTYTTWLVP